MKLFLSGEGPTDIGVTRPTAEGHQFVPGPMAEIVDALLEPWLGYSLLELHAGGGDCVRHVSETDLANAGKPGSTLFPGLKFGKGNLYFTRNAQALGLMAKADSVASGQPVVAVLFRDGDGTRAVPRAQWQEKFGSIQRGFALVECETGVPMVPRPKSEAWLLCALKLQAYQHCAGLEDESGNDNSPRALKRQLETRLGYTPGADEQATWVRSRRVDPTRIEMPSFEAFTAELNRAATAAGLPPGAP